MGLKAIIGYMVVLIVVAYPISGAMGELTAGDVDDNLNYDCFLKFIDRMQNNHENLPEVQIHDRVTIRILDSEGQGVSNAFLSISADGAVSPLIETYARSDGVFYFFPTLDGAEGETKFSVEVRSPDPESTPVEVTMHIDELGEDMIFDIALEDYISGPPDSLDLILVIDTTGSMSDELDYITREFEDIIGRVEDMYPGVNMRFGLVVYRDEGDKYVVRSYEFTESLTTMQQQLDDQRAGGGGDYPEAMDQALASAVEFQWRGGNCARMMFLVADAPPHEDKLQVTLDTVWDARLSGIHIYPLAASGVGDTAEYIMRIAASVTHGRYLFLTDDSGIGNPHTEPHIPAYIVTELDNLIYRVVGSELAGKRIEPTEDDIIRKVGEVENGVAVTSCGNDTDNGTYDSTAKSPVLLGADYDDSGLYDSSYPSDGGEAEGDVGMASESFVLFPLLCISALMIISIAATVIYIIRRKSKSEEE
jgi:hypothetical protein